MILVFLCLVAKKVEENLRMLLHFFSLSLELRNYFFFSILNADGVILYILKKLFLFNEKCHVHDIFVTNYR